MTKKEIIQSANDMKTLYETTNCHITKVIKNSVDVIALSTLNGDKITLTKTHQPNIIDVFVGGSIKTMPINQVAFEIINISPLEFDCRLIEAEILKKYSAYDVHVVCPNQYKCRK